MLPGDDEQIKLIEREGAALFDLSRRLESYGVALVDRNPSAALPRGTRLSAYSLFIRATKQHGSVTTLCRTARVDDAEAILRSVLETFFAMNFILAKRFRRMTASAGGRKRAIRTPKPALTREFRADLFAAHHAFDSARAIQRFRRTHGIKRYGRRLLAKEQAAVVAHWQAKIGPEWTAILQKNKSYSGLHLEDLATSLGTYFSRMYGIVYGLQSRKVHAGDVSDHFKVAKQDDQGITIEPRWQAKIDDAIKALRLSAGLYLGCMDTYNDGFEFGVAVTTAVSGFNRELVALS